MASILLTSTVVNAVLKPLRRRRRPDRAAHKVPIARQVAMPETTSFPSGHAASAFAFATGVTRELPTVGIPLHAVAVLVAYSRVHTGVHYPLDVVAGSVLGSSLSPVVTTALDRRRAGGRDPKRSTLLLSAVRAEYRPRSPARDLPQLLARPARATHVAQGPDVSFRYRPVVGVSGD
jgi:membrane-associated phospholipid phosphatase